MEIIKEVRPERAVDDYVYPAICVIRTNCYGSQWSFLSSLVAIAKSDFPDLLDANIRVVHFGGKYYAKTFGIEFEPTGCVDDSYEKILQLEMTL